MHRDRVHCSTTGENEMRLKVYDENGRHVSGCEVERTRLSMDEVRDIYAKGCGHVDAESMRKCGFPVESYTFTSDYYVTYGCGSNLNGCFAKVEVPYDVSPTEFVQMQIGPKYAFIYSEASWTLDGETQEDRYGLRQVHLQPQVSGE